MAIRIEMLKYLVLGGVNFLLTMAVFTGLLRLLGVNYLLSLIGAWLIGMLFMYVTSFVWVFKDNGGLRFDARFVKFASVGVLSIVFNTAILAMIVEGWSTDPFWTQMALLLVIVPFNFLATKFFSLRLGDASFDDSK